MPIHTSKKFLNPETVLFQAGLKAGQTIADLGAGSGFYAQAAAKIVGSQGMVHVVDIKDSALDHVVAEARMHGNKNIKTYLCNLDEAKLHTRLPESQCDMVVLANILHEIGHKENLMKHAYALLKSGGRLVIVDWNQKPSPIGPAADKRVSAADAKKLATTAFKHVKDLETDEYHYCLVFEK